MWLVGQTEKEFGRRQHDESVLEEREGMNRFSMNAGE